MNAPSDDHTLDRLLDSLNRFNRQQDEQERARKTEPAPDIALDKAQDETQDDAQYTTLADLLNDSAEADNLPNSTDALVSRADALMQRQSAALVPSYATLDPSFEPQPEVQPKNPFQIARQETHADDLDDLPVLTDIVSATQPKATEGLNVSDAPFTLPAAFDDEALAVNMEYLRESILDALRKRLDVEIPTLAEAALHSALPGIIQEIRLGLEENIHTALADLTQFR